MVEMLKKSRDDDICLLFCLLFFVWEKYIHNYRLSAAPVKCNVQLLHKKLKMFLTKFFCLLKED